MEYIGRYVLIKKKIDINVKAFNNYIITSAVHTTSKLLQRLLYPPILTMGPVKHGSSRLAILKSLRFGKKGDVSACHRCTDLGLVSDITMKQKWIFVNVTNLV